MKTLDYATKQELEELENIEKSIKKVQNEVKAIRKQKRTVLHRIEMRKYRSQ